MRRIKEVLRLKQALGLNDAEVARSSGIARSTVQEYLKRALTAGVDWAAAEGLSDAELEARLFVTAELPHGDRPLPDWEQVEKELRGDAVTLKLLWKEYRDQHPDGYQYTQYCEYFHAWQQRCRPPSMRRIHRAGESLEVDYAGMTLAVTTSGVDREAQIFVACLPCSHLIYAEATWTQGHDDWLGAHVRALAYIGGCPAKIVPDNLKSGVTEASYYDPVINRSYHNLARHYGTAIVPARVKKPRDKASAENGVKLVEMGVLAPLRHRRFFSLTEANQAIREKVEALNDAPFSPPREGSRRSLFEAVERTALKPLPADPFVIGTWMWARVNIDYHIAVDGHYYSVPYQLLQKKVDVFLTATVVTVLYEGQQVASHQRSALKAHHTTINDHMPPAHQAIARRTPEHLREEAAAIDPTIALFVDRLLTAREHPEQGVRACLGILRLVGTYGKARVALACERALIAGALSFRYVDQLLKADRRQPFLDRDSTDGLGSHHNVRGSSYYNGRRD